MAPPKTVQLLPDAETILERSRGVFFAQWEELLLLRRVVLKSSSHDDIHDLRVASRRFRAALELYSPFVRKGSKTELKKNVRKLTRTLGVLRNIDEALLFLTSCSNVDLAVIHTLCNTFSTLRSRELKQIEKTLLAFDHRSFDRIVREMVAGLNKNCITERNRFSFLAYFSDVSIRQYLPIHSLIASAVVPEHRTSRHALRVAIKKWRYFLEIISSVLDRDYTALLELLKEYQSILGRMNDIVEFEAMIETLNLSSEDRKQLKSILQAEDNVLLENLATLIEQKPLTYTFLI
jgi:CHAD domain-containing protein